MDKLSIKWTSIVLDAKDPQALMDFYSKLLGWDIVGVYEDYVFLANPDQGPVIGAQRVPTYQRPVWPPQEGMPDQGAHLDLKVSDLNQAVKKAESLGAVRAQEQFIDNLVVMIDPEGHPFCLYIGEPED
ncbi:VOC family protein [Proteiniclasticum sp. QWL-01]|uniref:VOC family protein n=1 Tax=Proteiniclasticum sp. QWL-01 TaxID=3036945 RepID=UPI00240EF641|nr:VOC family protein [Proteiniclasticum sp. QWL-01]WFF72592.1 VOC family protein [Proteiniclasticum sp. QWL-01]